MVREGYHQNGKVAMIPTVLAFLQFKKVITQFYKLELRY